MIKRILIIDDEEIVRRALQRGFEKKGYVVSLAVNGRQGLDHWAKFDPDLVVLDLMMPVMSGIELLTQRLGQDNPPIIVISAFTDGVDILKLKQLGATSFIAKPFENIFNVIEEIEAQLK